MKRPLCVIGLSLALATWAAFFFSARQALLLSVAAAVTGALFVAFRRKKLRALCAACFSAALALALHALYEVRWIEPFIAVEDQIVELEGLVVEQRASRRANYYTVSATFPKRDDLPDTTITIRSYGEAVYWPGEALRCCVKLKPLAQPDRGLRHDADNFLEGYLIQGSDELLSIPRSLQAGFLRLRERMGRNVYSLLRPESADIVTAMVLGMKDHVSSEAYAAVNRAGTSHLLSVSGLHLSIVTALVLNLLQRLRVPKRMRILLTIAAALAFSGLVGFSASILRSFVMTAIALAAGLGRRRGDSLSALGFAVTLICLLRPGWVLGRGFWLSAGSTLGILLFAAPLSNLLSSRLGKGDKLYQRVARAAVSAGAVSIAAYGVTLPLLVLFNGWISIVSPLANILVSPFVPVIIVGGMVCAAVGGASAPVLAVARVTDFCTAMVLEVSEIMGKLPLATAPLDEVWMLLWLALAIATIAVLLHCRADRRFASYAALLLVVVFGVGSLTQLASDRGHVELAAITQCDVEVLLQGKEAVILGTPQYYEVDRLLRYLEFRGIQRVRAVIASDCGEQIGSGIPRVAGRYPVDCVIGPNDSYILQQIALAVPDVPVYAGGYATLHVFDGVAVSILVPDGDLAIDAGNNMILKTGREYDIMELNDAYSVQLHPEDRVVLNGARGYENNPIGDMLYGEVRLRMQGS